MNEIQYRHTATGENLYATIRNAAGEHWNGTAFETLSVANWGTYDIVLAESPAGGYRYQATFPATIGDGTYAVDVYKRAGGSPAITDELLASGEMAWDGENEVRLDLLAAAATVAAIQAKTDNLPADPASETTAAAAQAAAESADGKLPADVPTAAEIDGELTAAHGAGAWSSESAVDWSGDERNQIRDALGVDGDKIDAAGGQVQDIKAKTDTIGNATITYTSPARASGSFLVYGGNDYLDADGRGIGVTVSDYGGPDMTGATAVMRLIEAADYQADETEAALEVAASVTGAGDTVSLTADLTASQTEALEPSPPDNQRNYVYQFVATTSGGSVITLAAGRMTVKKGIE